MWWKSVSLKDEMQVPVYICSIFTASIQTDPVVQPTSGVKVAGASHWPAATSSAKVKEGPELYQCPRTLCAVWCLRFSQHLLISRHVFWWDAFYLLEALLSSETSETAQPVSRYRAAENPSSNSHVILFPEMYVVHRPVTMNYFWVIVSSSFTWRHCSSSMESDRWAWQPIYIPLSKCVLTFLLQFLV